VQELLPEVRQRSRALRLKETCVFFYLCPAFLRFSQGETGRALIVFESRVLKPKVPQVEVLGVSEGLEVRNLGK